jgi:hypothetical protein
MKRGLCSCSHSASLHDATGRCTYSVPIGKLGTWSCGCAEFRAPDAELLDWWASLDQASEHRGESQREVSESEKPNGVPRPTSGFCRDSFFS